MTAGRFVRAYVSLGSNLGDRARSMGEARAALIGEPRVRVVSCSATIETDPVDVLDQPRFLNQVLGIETALDAGGLLDLCLGVERDLGRDRKTGPPRGPRTIDLDLLLYDGREIDEPGLTVPHPRLAERGFLLDLCRQAGAPQAWLPSQRVERRGAGSR
ncbi:MAG TPA: 2-amino-4-hydroxy-6-hydroxymethyldihydropteridine diphosphokinase [Gemmatimonadota bacterium]|nr:2-amino-4-hydroxy-6-hydroxymethyldihydropteridine diphosphokinase [Gemmatimonadota bacterium]